MAVPTEGHCDVEFAFHIRAGVFTGVPLDGLHFVVICYTPGIMSEGNWTTAIYVDQRADRRQREALGRVLSGDLGGPAERWMRLTENLLGTRYVPITYSAKGRTRPASIPEIMDFTVEGIRATRRSTRPIRLHNTAHPVNATLFPGPGHRQHLLGLRDEMG